MSETPASPVGDNTPATPAKKLGGVTGKGFKPGQSGNPSGRPKGVAALAQSLTGDGKLALQVLLDIMQGKQLPGLDEVPGYRERKECAVELLNRAYGKPAQPVDGDGEGGPIRLQIVSKLAAVLDVDLLAEDVTP